VLAREGDLDAMMMLLADYARRTGVRRVAMRVQGGYVGAYERLIAMGARVRWTDLRMTLSGADEVMPKGGIVWSNWEV
jgi:hypothetical protein